MRMEGKVAIVVRAEGVLTNAAALVVPWSKAMPISIAIPNGTPTPLEVTLDNGQSIFVLGANGTGKSSLVQMICSRNAAISRRISAHRQTWFASGSLTLTGEQKRQTQHNIQSTDAQSDSRWKDDYSAQRANIAIYDLIDAENVDAREIAAEVRKGDIANAQVLARRDAPIKAINELLRLSNLPISIEVHKNEQLMASKSGSALFSVAELSDGERNALLIAANVLTVPAGTLLLIDEPERHLHRSIISPLLTLLFKKRPDCAFVVSTHDVQLSVDNPSARTLLVRGCTYDQNRVVTQWDVDLVPADADIDDALKGDILGSRRKVLFVEGDEKSLDKPLYSIVFPGTSVLAKGGCVEVENVVNGIRAAPNLHWVHAFGLVDNDRRSPEEIARLKARGVYATAVHSVESIYYQPEIQRQVATRQAVVTGGDAATRVAAAKTAAMNAVTPHVARLSARAIEKTVVEEIQKQQPTQTTIAAGQPVNITVDVAALLAAEQTAFQGLIAAQDLERIVSRYPVRETSALADIARRLGFQDRDQYESAVRKLLMDDAAALTFVRGLFDTLYADVNA